MSSLRTGNAQAFPLNKIPFSDKTAFYASVLEGLKRGMRMTALFPPDRQKPEKLICVLSNAAESSFYIFGGGFESGRPVFESLSKSFPQTGYFECELAEKYGYSVVNHPWLRPVRRRDTPREFYKLGGDEVHEVAVGPIHAGIIEPGHFRFQCHGETVFNLEISLGYQHRGVEELMLKPGSRSAKLVLAESAAGDTVAGHICAHSRAVESLSGVKVSLRAHVIRAVAEELERTAMHLSGLGGLANDVGFSIVSASYGRLRTLAINSLAALSGSRFGRGLFVYGGVRFDFTHKVLKAVLGNLEIIRRDVHEINNCLFTSAGAMLRFENTGIVPKRSAVDMGFVGCTARACGIETDTRVNFPYGAYRYFPVSLITMPECDVFARAKLRALEIDESLRFIFEQAENLPEGELETVCGPAAANTGVISVTEGWRGEVVHIAVTDNDGNISGYRIKDPSFNNWYALSLALRNTQISDFPLCNKSFDLSYAGHDL
jgi:Ni,Fe-hydrogenase III large subunit